MKSIKNKVVLVTGGASGIGRAVAIKAAEEGAKVTLADVNEERGKEVVNVIRKNGKEAHFFKVDLSDPAQCEKLLEDVVALHGVLHFLCNSVGKQTYGTAETTTIDMWHQALDVNLHALFYASKYAIPVIRDSGGGAVVQISSVQGLACQENVLAYATSKGAVIAMTRALAMDHAKEGIAINCICPGSIDTPLLREGAAAHGPVEEVLRQWGASHPIGRIGTPAEVAEAVLFLWTSGFIAGQSLVIDGGLISKIL